MSAKFNLWICVFSILAFSCYLSLYPGSYIESDSIYPAIFAQDAIYRPHLIPQWQTPPSTYLFPDVFFHSLTGILQLPIISSFHLWGTLQLAAIAGAVFAFRKDNDFTVLLAALFTLSITILDFSFSRSLDRGHLLKPGMHTGINLVGVLTFIAPTRFVFVSRSWLIILGFLCGITAASDAMFITHWLTPFFLMLALIFAQTPDIKKAEKITVIFASFLLSYFLFRYFFVNRLSVRLIAPTWDFKSGISFLFNLKDRDPVLYFEIILTPFITALFLFLYFSSHNSMYKRQIFMGLSATLVAIFSFGMPVITGMLSTEDTVRYLAPGKIALAWLVSACVISLPKKIIAVVCATVIGGALFLLSAKMKQFRSADIKLREYMGCIHNAVDAEGIGIVAGGYWDSKLTEGLAELKNPVVQVDQNFNHLNWINRSKNPPIDASTEPKRLLILPGWLDPRSVSAKFGQNYKTIRCRDTDLPVITTDNFNESIGFKN